MHCYMAVSNVIYSCWILINLSKVLKFLVSVKVLVFNILFNTVSLHYKMIIHVIAFVVPSF